MKLSDIYNYNIKRPLNLNTVIELFIIKIKVTASFLLYIYKKF